MEKGISLSNYKTFQVELTSNGTNTSIPDIILIETSKRLRSKLSERGIIVTPKGELEEGSIVLRSTLLLYEAHKSWLPPGLTKYECIVQAELIDKKTNQSLGVFVAAGTYHGERLKELKTDLKPEIFIIDEAAESIAEEISFLVRRR
jgi:hypothetical protein